MFEWIRRILGGPSNTLQDASGAGENAEDTDQDEEMMEILSSDVEVATEEDPEGYKYYAWNITGTPPGTPLAGCGGTAQKLYSVKLELWGNGKYKVTVDIHNRSRHKKFANRVSLAFVDVYGDTLPGQPSMFQDGNWGVHQRKTSHTTFQRSLWMRDNFDRLTTDPEISLKVHFHCRRRNTGWRLF